MSIYKSAWSLCFSFPNPLELIWTSLPRQTSKQNPTRHTFLECGSSGTGTNDVTLRPGDATCEPDDEEVS